MPRTLVRADRDGPASIDCCFVAEVTSLCQNDAVNGLLHGKRSEEIWGCSIEAALPQRLLAEAQGLGKDRC